jgi:hypothetical protein
MSNLIAGEKLIYERVDNVVYARYPGRPDIPRWVIGWSQNTGPSFNYKDWEDMKRLAEDNPLLKKQLDKLLNLYYLIKEEK